MSSKKVINNRLGKGRNKIFEKVDRTSTPILNFHDGQKENFSNKTKIGEEMKIFIGF